MKPLAKKIGAPPLRTSYLRCHRHNGLPLLLLTTIWIVSFGYETLTGKSVEPCLEDLLRLQRRVALVGNWLQSAKDYGLSEELSSKLSAWNEDFQKHIHWEHGWLEGFDENKWNETGRQLALKVQ